MGILVGPSPLCPPPTRPSDHAHLDCGGAPSRPPVGDHSPLPCGNGPAPTSRACTSLLLGTVLLQGPASSMWAPLRHFGLLRRRGHGVAICRVWTKLRHEVRASTWVHRPCEAQDRAWVRAKGDRLGEGGPCCHHIPTRSSEGSLLPSCLRLL